MNRTSSSEPVGERVRIFQRGTTWHANYQLDGRQQRQSLNTENKKAAKHKALQLDRKLSDGELPAKAEPATFTEAINAYKEHLVSEERSAKTKDKYWSVFVRVEALAREMKQVSLLHLDRAFTDKYHAQRAKTCQPKTIYTEKVIIRQLVKFAFTRRMIPHDPLSGMKLKKPKPTPQPYFDEAQIEQILASARPPHAATFLLLAETGLRIGEAQWLSWADVDLPKNVIHVRAKDEWRPKTGDERVVPITAKLRVFLEGRLRRGRWVLTAIPTRGIPPGIARLTNGGRSRLSSVSSPRSACQGSCTRSGTASFPFV